MSCRIPPSLSINITFFPIQSWPTCSFISINRGFTDTQCCLDTISMSAYMYHKQLMSCLHAVAPQNSLFCWEKINKYVYIMLFTCTAHSPTPGFIFLELHVVTSLCSTHSFRFSFQSVPCKTVMGEVFSLSTSQEEAALKC